MFCDTPQVNQLTALLQKFALRHVVCCPGSRNATIVHNLNEACESFRCHPVTDERSAAFVALGLAVATRECVAVCVTSGSALLACLPAVAESFYRHISLLVISADRPPRQIGRLDGQTLPQNGALLPYCPTFQLVVPSSDSDLRFNNTLINKALASLRSSGGGPAHINIPIEEPMFSFTTPRLPDERLVRVVENAELSELPAEFLDAFREARFPALLIGQRDDADLAAFASVLEKKNALLVLPEVIAGVEGSLRMKVFDALDERKADDRPLMPDLIIQAGGNFIHKRFKERLRREDCRIVRVGEEMDWADTFERAEMIIKTSPVSFLRQLAAADITEKTAVRAAKTLYDRWVTAFTERLVLSFEDSLCGLHLFRVLYSSLLRESQPFSLHLGNSTAVRRAASVIPSGRFPVFCNRGTNGIEGSLSAAVGYALGRTEEKTIVVLGDLSFFYDANGLWNVRLPRGLRVLVMNNGRGSIFDGLEGLSASPARRDLIAAGGQHYSACGIAETFGLDYFAVRSEEDLQETIADWLNDTDKPALLEVFIED